MLELMQRFSTGNMAGVLVTMLVLWGVWPVICGVLGASRGGAGVGVMHGLMWGPIGLPIVLLSSKRHVCPTCGKRTLTEAAGGVSGCLPGFVPAGAPQTFARPCPAVETSSVSQPLSAAGETNLAAKTVDVDYRSQVIEAACAGYNAQEAARLRAWLNGDPISK